MEIERLKFCIERFDHYYDSVNNKGALFLGLSTFIVGGLVAAYPLFLDKVNCDWLIHLSLGCLIALGLAIMIIVIRSSTPFLANETDSVFYFGSVASVSRQEFQQKSEALGAEAELMDLRNQVYQLSLGLRTKFRHLRIAGWLFTIQFILFIPLILLLILHLKQTL